MSTELVYSVCENCLALVPGSDECCGRIRIIECSVEYATQLNLFLSMYSRTLKDALLICLGFDKADHACVGGGACIIYQYIFDHFADGRTHPTPKDDCPSLNGPRFWLHCLNYIHHDFQEACIYPSLDDWYESSWQRFEEHSSFVFNDRLVIKKPYLTVHVQDRVPKLTCLPDHAYFGQVWLCGSELSGPLPPSALTTVRVAAPSESEYHNSVFVFNCSIVLTRAELFTEMRNVLQRGVTVFVFRGCTFSTASLHFVVDDLAAVFEEMRKNTLIKIFREFKPKSSYYPSSNTPGDVRCSYISCTELDHRDDQCGYTFNGDLRDRILHNWSNHYTKHKCEVEANQYGYIFVCGKLRVTVIKAFDPLVCNYVYEVAPEDINRELLEAEINVDKAVHVTGEFLYHDVPTLSRTVECCTVFSQTDIEIILCYDGVETAPPEQFSILHCNSSAFCFRCDRTFTCWQDYFRHVQGKRHAERTKTKANAGSCPQCGVNYTSQLDRISHEFGERHAGNTNGGIPCRRCDEVFYDVNEHRNHYRSAHVEESTGEYCSICHVTVSSAEQMDIHLAGSRHNKRLQNQLQFCAYCGIAVGSANFGDHSRGERHRSAVAYQIDNWEASRAHNHSGDLRPELTRRFVASRLRELHHGDHAERDDWFFDNSEDILTQRVAVSCNICRRRVKFLFPQKVVCLECCGIDREYLPVGYF